MSVPRNIPSKITLPHATYLGACLFVAIQPIIRADEQLIAIPVPKIDFALRDDYSGIGNLLTLAPLREPSLFPDMEDGIPPPDDQVKESGDSRILELALKVAPAVVSLRVWDEFGAEIASGVGVLVSPDGVILTDAELLHPARAAEIDYITVLTGSGLNFRVEEILHHSMTSGIALLGIDSADAPFLELDPDFDFADHPDVTMIGLHPTNGLSLNDATIHAAVAPVASGWLDLTGTDSPGAIGSPVFSPEGRVVALVALHVPLGKWMNLALPITPAATLLESGSRGAGQSLEAFRRTEYRPVTNDSRFLTAWEKINARQYMGAESAFLDLTRRYPREAVCWALLALAANENGHSPDAVASARMAVALNPTVGEYWKNFAAIAGQADSGSALDSDSLRESLEAATDDLPRDRRSWLALAEQYVRTLQFDKAERALRQVISIDSDNGHALYLLAYSQGKLGKVSDAQLTVSRAVSVQPKNTECWFLMGLLYTETKQPALAAESFEKVVSLEPRHTTAWINLARAWKAAGNSTKALIAFRNYQNATAKAPDLR
jgi:Tfp pilus assembly protein PilF